MLSLSKITMLAFSALLIPGLALADPYRVTIHTSKTKNSGTNSTIKVQFFGKKGNKRTKTPKYIVDPIGDSYENGQWDTDVLNIENLGRLYKMKLMSDGGGKKPGWLPKTIFVTNLKTGSRTDFGVNQWIGGKGDPRSLILKPSNQHQYSKKELKKQVLSSRKALQRNKKKKGGSSFSYSKALKYIKDTADTINAVKDVYKP
ncbi:MAG: hypothetical protein HOH65_12270 [Rhodospirillaceae bacterium]|jgi:hypothetical protein|nr:hypothetical protein [Rhodospirillaceae bacterium]